MNIFLIILSIFTGGALLTWIADKISHPVRDGLFVLTLFAASTVFLTSVSTDSNLVFSLGKFNMHWGVDDYRLLFGYIVMMLSPLAGLYSLAYMKNGDRLGYFYLNFLLSVMAMFGVIISMDLISFFIFWEIMTWSSYLIVIYKGNNVDKRGLKYFIFSAVGAYAMLMAIVILISQTGSTEFSHIAAQFGSMPGSLQLLVPILLLIGFGVKSAIMPLHVWAPAAYAESPMGYTTIFSGALSKMGILGVGLVYFYFLSADNVILREVVAWMAAITSVLATFYAVIQKDAKKLLAYSSIAQLGYIVVALSIGTYLGVMAALFLAVIHAVFKGTLFMAIGAVERQTGSTDMTVVTGLIRKMPLTFFATLVSIIALAGVPPVAGFIGKWLMYEALITSNHYLLVIVVFVSSTAAFLYCYRILFGLFLGQEEPEFKNVKEAPIGMLIPMLLLTLVTIISGTFPGLIFEPIQRAMISMGWEVMLPDMEWWQMTVLYNGWGDKVSLMHVSMSVMIVFVTAFIFLTIKAYKKTRYVSTKDISTSGEVPKEEDNLTYQLNFYRPFERAIAPVLKRSIDKYYTSFGRGLESLFDFVRKIYTGNGQTYAFYVMIFLVLLFLAGRGFFGL